MEMDRRIARLTNGRFVVGLLLVTIAISVAFGFTSTRLGGPLLDLISGEAANEARLAAMSAAQKAEHLRITLMLDLVYPTAYGGGLASLAARLSPDRKLFAASPALALILADLVENALIVAMLGGNHEVVAAKSIATQIKWCLFAGSCLLVLALAATAMFRHYGRAAQRAGA